MGSPRYPRPGDRLRAPLERAHRDRGPEDCSLAGRGLQQVLRLAGPLRQGERTQRLGSPRFLAGRAGEAGDCGVPRPLPSGRLSPADVHDAGCRRGGRESGQRLASLAPSRPIGALEEQTLEQGPGLSATAGAAPALARGYLLSQSGGHVLLSLQRTGRLQPLLGALGNPRVDDRGRGGDHFAAGARAVPRGRASYHLRQRAAVYGPRLQRVHPDLRHDPRAHLAVLSAVEREDREVAPIAERRRAARRGWWSFHFRSDLAPSCLSATPSTKRLHTDSSAAPRWAALDRSLPGVAGKLDCMLPRR
jgi:hypothetical protein